MLNVFNIQRYSLHDGEGIRTNVFFKGCALRCKWCNNPEGLDTAPSIMFDDRKCRQFGDCMGPDAETITVRNGSLVINRDLVTDPSVYRNICPSKALIISGENMSVSHIMQEIEKDIPFYNNGGGGVTFTGGEPFLQGPELGILMTEIKKKGIHISVETSLHMPWENIKPYIGLTDVFLADLKHTDSVKFAEFTGGDVSLVLNNFRQLNTSGREYMIRIPVIPMFNFSPSELNRIIDFATELDNASGIDFIPYHSLAKEKYQMLGIDYPFEGHKNIEKKELLPFMKYAERKGITTNILN
jgi:pyruvate formate lyase activating enzyme